MSLSKPKQIQTAFSEDGLKFEIPNDSQIGVTPGKASYETGFPPLNFVDPEEGGQPPYGEDFNGVLYEISDAVRYSQAGGGYPYDADFATAIGGYPLGALVLKADGSGYWKNELEGNTTDPDGVGSSDWGNLSEVQPGSVTTASFAVDAKAPLAGAADSATTAGTANAVAAGGVTSSMLNDALITALTNVTPTTSDTFMIADASDSGKLKEVSISDTLALVTVGSMTQLGEWTYSTTVATFSFTVDLSSYKAVLISFRNLRGIGMPALNSKRFVPTHDDSYSYYHSGQIYCNLLSKTAEWSANYGGSANTAGDGRLQTIGTTVTGAVTNVDGYGHGQFNAFIDKTTTTLTFSLNGGSYNAGYVNIQGIK